MSVRETLDPDMWWHLKTGQVIIEQGLPERDLFSFTVPDHEWIVQEWLTDVAMWLVYRAAGLAGLSLVFAALIATTYWLVYRQCPGRPYLAAFVVLVAVLAASLPLGIRPQMVNIFFLALFATVVEGFRRTAAGPESAARARRWLFLLPPLSLLWANMHSGYLAGFAYLGATLAGEATGRWWDPPGRRPSSPWSTPAATSSFSFRWARWVAMPFRRTFLNGARPTFTSSTFNSSPCCWPWAS
jgi:hypothetical protein